MGILSKIRQVNKLYKITKTLQLAIQKKLKIINLGTITMFQVFI